MRVLFAILLNVFIINGVFCQKNVKIKINNNSLEINDSCIYLKKEVYQSTFKGLKKIIDNENYFKIKVNKNHINYIFRNEGLGFEYMNRNFIGPPLISIYFSQDTAWSNLFYKKKYLDIGKYHGKLTILDYNISEITTYFEF